MQADFDQPAAVALEDISVVPADLAVNRRWVSNGEGYVYSTWYFSPQQVESEAWETARLDKRKTAQFCNSETVVRRDVRWLAPIAVGEPQCAIVVYSIACSPGKLEQGGELNYEREQALLDEPENLPSRNCGEKACALQPPSLNQPRFNAAAIVTPDADCKVSLDFQSGKFQLRKVNYLSTRTFVSPKFIKEFGAPRPGNQSGFLHHAASLERKVHLVVVSRPLAEDGENILIEQSFAADGESFCVTLTAQQGHSSWRKTIRVVSDQTSNLSERDRPATPSPFTVEKTLQLDLAEHLGIHVTKDQRLGRK